MNDFIVNRVYCIRNRRNNYIMIEHWNCIRVLLVKVARYVETHLFGQYLFVCIIKSTHQVDVPGNKTWDLRAKTVQWQAILDLGPRQKWVDLPDTFFQLFMSFLVDFHILHNILKIWNTHFPFRQNMANFHFQHGQKIKILTHTIKQQSFIFYK